MFIAKLVSAMSDEELTECLTAIGNEQARRLANKINALPELDMAECLSMRKGDMIEACLHYRNRTGLELKDAKIACENYAASLRDVP